MPLNPGRVGHRYPAYRYEVSRQKVREYARATAVDPADPADLTEPGFLADAGDLAVPPAFAACFTLSLEGDWMRDPELGAHAALLHAGQAFTFHRPLRVGDALRCTPWVADVRARGGTGLLTLQVDCVDEADGSPVVTARSTIVLLDPAG